MSVISEYEDLKKRERRLQDAIFALKDIDAHPEIQEQFEKELAEIKEKIKNYWKEKTHLLNKDDYEFYSGRSFDEDFSKKA